MSIALAQSSLGTNATTTYNNIGGSVSVSAGLGNTTAGSLIVFVGYYHFQATSQPVETGGYNFPTGGTGLTWRQIINGGYGDVAGVNRANAILFFAGNAPAQTTPTISATLAAAGGPAGSTGNIFGECAIYEFTGTALSTSASTGGPLVDVDAALQSQTTGTPHTANLSTTNTDLVIVVSTQTGSGIGAGPGYTLGQTAANLSSVTGQLQYQLNVAPGSIATSFLSGTPANWGAGAIAFMPAPAAPSGTSVNYGYHFG